jgi:hypothetical protein
VPRDPAIERRHLRRQHGLMIRGQAEWQDADDPQRRRRQRGDGGTGRERGNKPPSRRAGRRAGGLRRWGSCGRFGLGGRIVDFVRVRVRRCIHRGLLGWVGDRVAGDFGRFKLDRCRTAARGFRPPPLTAFQRAVPWVRHAAQALAIGVGGCTAILRCRHAGNFGIKLEAN